MATKRTIPVFSSIDFDAPILVPVLADERLWCKYARRDDASGAGGCPEFRGGPGERPYCGLNGIERSTLCAFDEAPDAQIWREIEESVAEYRARGWM